MCRGLHGDHGEKNCQSGGLSLLTRGQIALLRGGRHEGKGVMLNTVTAEFISQLRGFLPAAAFPELSDKYLTEPRGHYHGSAGLLVAPDSTAQVAQVIAAAAAARIGVVPYGGGTGLVGGQILPASETGAPAPLILSLGRMRRIRACYP